MATNFDFIFNSLNSAADLATAPTKEGITAPTTLGAHGTNYEAQINLYMTAAKASELVTIKADSADSVMSEATDVVYTHVSDKLDFDTTYNVVSGGTDGVGAGALKSADFEQTSPAGWSSVRAIPASGLTNKGVKNASDTNIKQALRWTISEDYLGAHHLFDLFNNEDSLKTDFEGKLDVIDAAIKSAWNGLTTTGNTDEVDANPGRVMVQNILGDPARRDELLQTLEERTAIADSVAVQMKAGDSFNFLITLNKVSGASQVGGDNTPSNHSFKVKMHITA